MKLAIKSALTLGSIFGVRRLARYLGQYDLDDALSAVGLERRSSAAGSALPAIGLVVLGAAIGAGAALVFAPSSGRDLRERMSGKVNEAKHRLENAAERNMGRSGGAHHSSSS